MFGWCFTQEKELTVLKTMARWIVLGVLSISVASASAAETAETKAADDAKTIETAASKPASAAAEKPATPCCGEKAAAAAKASFAPPPCSCPLYPVAVLGSNTVYYASRYATSCDDSPTAAYVYGSYAYPLVCPGGTCVASWGGSCLGPVEGGFPGFPSKFPQNHEHSMPSDGVAPIFARRLIDSDVPFISFVDNMQNERWAKVFTYRINVRGAQAVVQPGCEGEPRPIDLVPQVIYFALEIPKTSTPPDKLRHINSATALNEKSQPTGSQSFVYLAKYNTPDGEAIPILVLCAQ